MANYTNHVPLDPWARIPQVMGRLGLTDVDQFANVCEACILALHNIGAVTLGCIKDILELRGLTLAEYPCRIDQQQANARKAAMDALIAAMSR